jgi:colanic acid/amylovoran biosynthesis protein
MSREKSGAFFMDNDRPLFILAGNGPYQNRGCEAILRGTVKILRKHFQDPLFLCISVLQKTDLIQQINKENDPAITHKKINSYQSRFSWEWGIQRIIYRFNAQGRNYRVFNEMLPYIDDSAAVLSLGGDNYSLDYGIPQLFTDLDDIVLEKKKPLILWGSSVGPFDALPEYERYMIDHLKKINGIYAREPVTVDYLTKHGIHDNVHQVADPAFLMDPMEPQVEDKRLIIDEDAIGINLSPLMAEYLTGGDIKKWEHAAANIISSISKKTSRSIYLVPHVTIRDWNDFTFLETVWNMLDPQIKSRIILIPPDYNAAEIKWIISQMALFAGARTHATIAALSSQIPTLSFAYSIKAYGINRDIFGHEEYCLGPYQLKPEIVTTRIESMLMNQNLIRAELKEKIPLIQKKTMNAGKYLKELLGHV